MQHHMVLDGIALVTDSKQHQPRFDIFKNVTCDANLHQSIDSRCKSHLIQ